MHSLNEILITLKSSDNIAVDDRLIHATLRNQLIHIKAVGTVDNRVVSFDPQEMKQCCVNMLYIGPDDLVHISRLSVGIAQNGDYASFIRNITSLSNCCTN